jgi:Na+-driven multidrug efflux pump
MIRRILRIGIPNGLENSMFQFGKILVISLVAEFGTVGITANAVANSVANFNCIPGSAIGLAMITVVGQCVGAGDLDQAKKYIWKLLKYACTTMLILNFIMILVMPQLVGLFQVEPDTYELAYQLLIYHCICCIIIWPLSFTLPNTLRAANDVKFTMTVSIFSMWVFRIVLSFVLARNLGLGVFGIWIAMTIDWVFRAILFVGRLMNGRWKRYAYMNAR